MVNPLAHNLAFSAWPGEPPALGSVAEGHASPGWPVSCNDKSCGLSGDRIPRPTVSLARARAESCPIPGCSGSLGRSERDQN
jgi:hypothetical protein